MWNRREVRPGSATLRPAMRLNSRPLQFLLDRGRRALLLSLLPLSVTFGCLGMRVGGSQDDDSSMGGAKADPRPDVEPGSCNGWKVSYCDAVKTCQSSQAAERCKATVGYVRCLDDAPVGRCAKEIDKTVASEKCALPEDCHPGDIADRRKTPAACSSSSSKPARKRSRCSRTRRNVFAPTRPSAVSSPCRRSVRGSFLSDDNA
jgi:hypothetical protein